MSRLAEVRALALTVVIGLAGCTQESASPRQESAVNMAEVTVDLQTMSKARILLGHQSVGRDILAGLRSLAADAGVPLRIVQIDGIPPDDKAGVFHSAIGTNGDPDGKCEMFSQLLTRPERPAYDVAMMKFCFVDLGEGTPLPATKMLDHYARMVSHIREQRPDVRLAHITVPLMSDPPGKKTLVKRLLGRSTERDADNVLRNEFNAGLRQHYSGEPLFDLAAVESTLPDGSRSSFSRSGQTVYTLAQVYTNDGGHLNELGQRRAAAAFVRTVAHALSDGTGVRHE
jgi:lysophospholipase L1-like esterase